MYRSDNVNRALIEKQLKGYEKALSLIPAINKVAKKFDGKKISKRFDTALKTIDENLSFNIECNSFRVKYYVQDRYITGKRYTEYIKDYPINIVFNSVKSCYNDGICQDDVFSYKNFVKCLDAFTMNYSQYILETKKQLDEIETLQKERERILTLKENFNNKVSYIINSYYDLRI